MQFHLRTLIDYSAISAYLLIVFAIIGTPVKLLLRCTGVTVARMIPAAVMGLAIVVVTSWYWATPLGATKPVARLLLAVAVVAVVVVVVLTRKSRPLRRVAEDGEVRVLMGMGALCFAGLLLAMIVNDTQLFTREHFTVLTLGNNDAPSYALLGQQLLDEGPGEAGNIANYNAGSRSIGFSGGALSTLAGAASLTGLDVWRVMTPMMLVTLTLGAYSLALLIRRVLSGRHAMLAAGAAIVGFSVLFVSYLVAQWFFAQLLAMSFVFAVTGIFYATVRSQARRDMIAGVLIVSGLLSAGLAIYPHMTIVGTLVLLPIVAVAPAKGVTATFLATGRRGLRTAALYGAACAVAAVAVPGLVSDAIDITRELEAVEAGWSLPAIFPSEMLGFQTSPSAGKSSQTVVVSVAFVLGLLAAAAFVWRRRRDEAVAALVAAIVVVLGTYALVYAREGGPTYRQWKWVTFFIPLFVASALALLGLLVTSLSGRAVLARRAAPVTFAAYVVIVLLFSSGAGFPLRPPADNAYLAVTLDEINLRHDPRLTELPSLHINTTPFWETMWIAYFLRDVPLTLGPPTYYASAPAAGPWYLERNDQPLAPGTEATSLNATYRLVKMPT